MRMLARRSPVQAGLLALPLLLVAVGGPAQGQDTPAPATPVVTAAVQVTTRTPTRPGPTPRPQLARNPKTGELVIAETEYRTTLACNVHISTDDGRTGPRAASSCSTRTRTAVAIH